MILIDKTQCRSCAEFGRVKGLDGFCCIGVDEDGTVHCDKAAKRSNCWCFDHKPNSKPFHMKLFHIIGKYFSERYGKNVRLMPVDENGKNCIGRNNATCFKISIHSKKLIFPIKAFFTIDLSIGRKKNMYSVDDIAEIIKNYEVQDV